jgi:hypothetical protein
MTGCIVVVTGAAATDTMIPELVRDWSTPAWQQLVQRLFASAPMQPTNRTRRKPENAHHAARNAGRAAQRP